MDTLKTGTKWVVEFKKDWAEMGIKVEGKENWGNKYTTNSNMLELGDKEGYKNRIEKN